jgi:hypothetical protein
MLIERGVDDSISAWLIDVSSERESDALTERERERERERGEKKRGGG